MRHINHFFRESSVNQSITNSFFITQECWTKQKLLKFENQNYTTEI